MNQRVYIGSYKPSSERLALTEFFRMDETQAVQSLLAYIGESSDVESQRIEQDAYRLIEAVRKAKKTGMDSFLATYDLSSQEGIALMCLAEAMLRIPDKATVDQLIGDKIGSANWSAHLGKGSSFFVNTATWALMLTGRVVRPTDEFNASLTDVLIRASGRLGEGVIRKAVWQAMAILSGQFVIAEKIDAAIKKAKPDYRYSYDMLGEAARTHQDARAYEQAYHQAIETIGQLASIDDAVIGPSISVKLSALYPRYEYARKQSLQKQLYPKIHLLIEKAKQYNIGLTLDAEEADRLDIMLDVVDHFLASPLLDNWQGFGIALQAYQKGAFYVIDWLVDRLKQNQRRMNVRLVKGAYWDTEIKHSQVLGLQDYPVFTKKSNTDLSYLACAKKLLEHQQHIFPQFATHNAMTVASILSYAKNKDYEFQRLHGMGESLYESLKNKLQCNIPCRVYAPVGEHEHLLAYLVRRLLENGANTSFVNRILDNNRPIESLIEDPINQCRQASQLRSSYIPLPRDLYHYENRLNPIGPDLSSDGQCQTLAAEFAKVPLGQRRAGPLVDGKLMTTKMPHSVHSPFDTELEIGLYGEADVEHITAALAGAQEGFKKWSKTPVVRRAEILETMANRLEDKQVLFLTLLMDEAGKTLPNAIAEWREAIDFCRYYAQQARVQLASPQILPGPTGEHNELTAEGRGVIVCISPWNFPLAIFLGQVAAALVAGNTVIAKPAEQTPLVAFEAVRLFYDAGLPASALHLLPGGGKNVGMPLIKAPQTAGVLFTGSCETARLINQTLAAREGPIIPLIAETGGQNAMIVDSTALPEQTVMDVIRSAFDSSGQRCSALRVLYIQQEVFGRFTDMLVGAMETLQMGDPRLLATDIGPVIDKAALERLKQHAHRMAQEAKCLYQLKCPSSLDKGYFFPPTVYQLESINQLQQEVFGPILHVIPYQAKNLAKVIDEINSTGFGLTFGVHSRLSSAVDKIAAKVHAGNCYVNRDTVGAVVGVQPFGGQGLSGTGPKAGGPHYLWRLVHERTTSINTTALGGNATLLSLEES